MSLRISPQVLGGGMTSLVLSPQWATLHRQDYSLCNTSIAELAQCTGLAMRLRKPDQVSAHIAICWAGGPGWEQDQGTDCQEL